MKMCNDGSNHSSRVYIGKLLSTENQLKCLNIECYNAVGYMYLLGFRGLNQTEPGSSIWAETKAQSVTMIPSGPRWENFCDFY